jgi:4-amino-4-deoxy-L-arabinose transferase-like glycosyltransferase
VWLAAVTLFLVALSVRAVVIGAVVSRYDTDESAVVRGGLRNTHGIVKGDLLNYYIWGHQIVQEVLQGRTFFLAGPRYEYAFLYPRLIALYGLATGGIAMGPDGTVPSGQLMGVFLVQSTVFALAVSVAFVALTRILPFAIAAGAAVFLALEPTLVQYSSLLLTETFFLAFLLFALAAWISAYRRVERAAPAGWFFAMAGLSFGLAFLQRPVALFLPPVAIAVLPLSPAFRAVQPLARSALQLLVPFAAAVALLAAHNLFRAGFAYVMPQQSMFIPQVYVASDVVAGIRGIPVAEALRELAFNTLVRAKAEGLVPADDPAYGMYLPDQKDPAWTERQFYEFNKMRQRDGINTLLQYPVPSARLILGRTIRSVNVDPFFAVRHLQTSLRSSNPVARSDFEALRQRTEPFRYAYSALILLPVLAGMLFAWGTQNRVLTAFLVCLVAYFVVLTGYMGNGRYLLAALISYSVFWPLAVREGYVWLRRRHT